MREAMFGRGRAGGRRDVATEGGLLPMDVAGAGPAVVMLHGWTLDRRVWRPQMSALSRACTVAAPDRRGFGAATAPADLAREADDLLAILDALGVERCALVGQSQAGRVALRFAAARPERVWALVLQGAPLDGLAPGAEDVEEAIPLDLYRALVQRGELAALRGQWRAHALTRPPHGRYGRLLAAMVEAYDGRDLLAPAPAAPESLAERLSEIAAPTLVVTGEHDTAWRRRVGDMLAGGLPRGERAVIAGAGHLCNLARPKAFNAALGDFLARHAPE